MYDGAGRPFMFGCRTNGALVWDAVRRSCGMEKDDYAPAEKALRETPPGEHLVFWQPRDESFPPSGRFDRTGPDGGAAGLGPDYAGVIESSLASVCRHSRGFSPETEEPLSVTGGASGSPEIMRRVAAVWNRPVRAVEQGGAALGAAVAGAWALLAAGGEKAGGVRPRRRGPPPRRDAFSACGRRCRVSCPRRLP
jgi:xylulokinase